MQNEYVFDIDEWRTKLEMNLPIDFRRGDKFSRFKRLDPNTYDMADVERLHVTSPCSLVVIDELRRQVFEKSGITTGIPTDVFVFSLGEPPERHVTKIGGAPYRPAGLPWPCPG